MERSRWWVFTFGDGHGNEGSIVRIKGTFDKARTKMFELFGDKWAFQYTEEEYQEWLDRKPLFIPAETEMMRLDLEDGSDLAE